MQKILIRKEFSVILVGVLIILSLTPVVNSGVNIKNEELSKQDTVEKNCLCQQNINNDHTLYQLNSWGKDDEHGYSLMRNYDNDWEQQIMGVPSGTGTICGYITDEETGLPVENAKVEIQASTYDDYIYTNSTGFYIKIIPPAYYIGLYLHGDGYLSKYYGGYFLYENDTLWVNLSLRPLPPESSIVYGYVTDEVTSDPVEDAKVNLRWDDENGHYENYTYTNYLGFYSMNVGALGEIILIVDSEDYLHWYSGDYYEVGENETVWVNISIYPRPPENSVICGYVLDNETGDLLENAEVEFHWNVGYALSYTNSTYTNSQGYYSINAAAGKVRVEAHANGYWDKSSPVWILDENVIAWVNLSPESLPPENCIVCGYITDVNTSEPIEVASITLNWEEYWGGRFWNRTYTGTSGFYKMNLPAGEFYLSIKAHGYLFEKTINYNLDENETIWLNISMYTRSPRSSIVCGYVTDEDSGEPIVDALTGLNWRDPYGHSNWYYKYTNASGYYSIKTAAGEIQLKASHYHYFYESTGWLTIGENETLWVNFTLKLDNRPPCSPSITGPTRGKPGQEYNYTFNTDDYYHNDDFYLYVDWGDGTSTDWIGPYHLFEDVVLNHTWSGMGNYYIIAKAKDVYGAESYWSELKVWMPRNKVVRNTLFLRLLERFPFLQKVLVYLIKWATLGAKLLTVKGRSLPLDHGI